MAGPCAPLPRRVTRLTDRHLANAINDLLQLGAAPALETGAIGGKEDFLPNKPAGVNGAVALKLREVVEAAALVATAAGKPAVACIGAAADCARAFIDRFAPRAFRRPLSADERTRLFALYDSEQAAEMAHAAGIRAVIEAVLQSPSFIYAAELGAPAGPGRYKLSPHEIAAELSFYLRDTVPDELLWRAAEDGRLATPAGVAAETDRLLRLPEVKANLNAMFVRLFQIDRINTVTKAADIREMTPALAKSMATESQRFIEDLLWTSGAKLSTLLTSRRSFIDPALAVIYGIKAPSATGFAAAMLPDTQRAGILTHPSIMTIEALPEESSVVHRGVFLARELLCLNPPPPAADDLAVGDMLKMQEATERGRAEKRAMQARCAGCHSFFDPLGVAFENYDTLGRYRTTIKTPAGNVPVNASVNLNIFDLTGPVANATELATRMAGSTAVKDCMARQIASYGLGQRIPEGRTCATAELTRSFEASGGDLVQLVRAVALWEAARERGPEEDL
jgi:hypothetical protein